MTVQHVTVTTSTPIVFNHWGPYFDTHPAGGANVGNPVGRREGWATLKGARNYAETLLGIVRDGEVLLTVTVDERESDLDSVRHYVVGPVPAEWWEDMLTQ